MRIVILDHWYDEAYRDWQRQGGPKIHGTADHWDVALATRGHECTTLIQNAEADIIAKSQSMHPDIVCSENIGLWNSAFLREKFQKSKLVGFCSYAASDENLKGWDVLFSSFAWRVEKLRSEGENAIYLNLAFGKSVLNYVKTDRPRDIPVSFVGGVNAKIWARGMETLTAIAREFGQSFFWYGYGHGHVPVELQRCYRGPAWGLDYFRVLARSKITINRHGEIAKNESQNMRCFEATGCGACLMTEDSQNIEDLFIPGDECFAYYEEPALLIQAIREVLADPSHAREVADAGQARTIRDHCYENRVDAFLEAIECL